MPRAQILLVILPWLVGCGTKPTVRANVSLDELLKGKTKVLPDAHEAVPSTFFELKGHAGDTVHPPGADSAATGAISSASLVVCATATETQTPANTGRCEVTIPAGTYKLKYLEAVNSTGSGAVRLSCLGDSPADCAAIVIN